MIAVKNYFLAFLFLFLSFFCSAQDSLYTRKIISELTSSAMHGRGYVNDGDKIAAEFIREEFKKAGLESSGNYFQTFSFPVNTFPGEMKLKVDDKELIPGVDFLISPSSSSAKGNYKIKTVNQPVENYKAKDFKKSVILLDTTGSNGIFTAAMIQQWKKNPFKAAGIIFIAEKKLTWSVSTSNDNYFSIQILRSSLIKRAEKIEVNIQQKFIAAHSTQNVVGTVKGNIEPDSFIFITAHYDHLGEMGKGIYFPGANDNASGVSMLLNLAHYFSKKENLPKYSMVFIAFAGEEAGLIGSEYFTVNPIVPLSKILFLLNLDLLGTGDKGLMVVNGAVYNDLFERMENINAEKKYFPVLGKRGKAQNSDHYFFTEKGVPAFFCYTMGGISAYHDIYDKAETLPLTRYKEAFNLFRDFLDSF